MFALGTWVGGPFTLGCRRRLAAKGCPITAVALGSDKREILRVIPERAPHFDQVVLLGYPPFLKDVIDTGNPGPVWSGPASRARAIARSHRRLVRKPAQLRDVGLMCTFRYHRK